MRKTITLLITAIVVLTMFSATTAKQEEVESTKHSIEINTENGKITVKETIAIEGETNETFETVKFWIQNGATEINVKSEETELTKTGQTNNVHTYTISSPDVTKDSPITVTLSYKLPEQTESFQKKLLLNNTEEISVKLDGKEIYTATDLKNNSYFDLTLYDVAETPLTWYIISFIVLLIILLGVTAIYSFKKPKLAKKRDASIGSEEFLNTKKTLLMSLLKDIEKQHRSKKISDDTYHKLKEQYKQETVATMKKLEDTKSKVK